MSQLAFLMASQLGPMLQSKQLSPVELTEHLLNRINKYDATLRTYITSLQELSLKQAKEAENDIMRLEIIRRRLPFTSPTNLTGLPSLSVPMGLCSNGMPVGMQFIGKNLAEQPLLQVGNAWESNNQPLRLPGEGDGAM